VLSLLLKAHPNLPPAYAQVCWNCGVTCGEVRAKSGKALLVCGRCKKGRYCSGDCQKAHWRSGHKAFCSAT
jgi:hypothetical protein